MKLKSIGFFKELKHGDEDSECLRLLTRKEADKNENGILQYLSSGITICVSPGIVKDVLDDSKIIGSLSILTDGIWVWPSDLLYYVKEYHINLNNDFVLYMSQNNWTVPVKSEVNMEMLEL
ncbi:MAG TPA: hypothetical protein VN258_13650 [Mobilitalea sp.]|nr:hypothetical protein [Mobilitalea sp.]